jgi:hypothetical protein
VRAMIRTGIQPGARPAVAPQEIRNGLRARRGRSLERPASERCAAVVFLAAVGYPSQCRFLRRDGVFCSRHRRERIDAN